MVRITVEADIDDFDVFDNVIVGSVSLTERQRALLSTALGLINRRDVWEPITDAEWDQLESDIASIEGELT